MGGGRVADLGESQGGRAHTFSGSSQAPGTMQLFAVPRNLVPRNCGYCKWEFPEILQVYTYPIASAVTVIALIFVRI